MTSPGWRRERSHHVVAWLAVRTITCRRLVGRERSHHVVAWLAVVIKRQFMYKLMLTENSKVSHKEVTLLSSTVTDSHRV